MWFIKFWEAKKKSFPYYITVSKHKVYQFYDVNIAFIIELSVCKQVLWLTNRYMWPPLFSTSYLSLIYLKLTIINSYSKSNIIIEIYYNPLKIINDLFVLKLDFGDDFTKWISWVYIYYNSLKAILIMDEFYGM